MTSNIPELLAAVQYGIDRAASIHLALEPNDAVALVMLLTAIDQKLPPGSLGVCESQLLKRAAKNLADFLVVEDFQFKALKALSPLPSNVADFPAYLQIMAKSAQERPVFRRQILPRDYRLAVAVYVLRQLDSWSEPIESDYPVTRPNVIDLMAQAMAEFEGRGENWVNDQLDWFQEHHQDAAAQHWEDTVTTTLI